MAEEDRQQLFRYLFPAFASYLVAAWFAADLKLKKKKKALNGKEKAVTQHPENSLAETARGFVEMNIGLLGGLAAYYLLGGEQTTEWITYPGFVIGWFATEKATVKVLENIVQYDID